MNNRGGGGGDEGSSRIPRIWEYVYRGAIERCNLVFFFPLLFFSFFFFSKSKYAKLNERGRKKLEKRNESSRHAPLFPRMYKSQYEGGREIPRAGN